MSLPQFDELPFNARPDLSPYLLHLTKNTKVEDDYSAFDNLVNILQVGKIFGSNSSKGFIKGPHKATCFMDIPFQALKYVLTPENADLAQGATCPTPTEADRPKRPPTFEYDPRGIPELLR